MPGLADYIASLEPQDPSEQQLVPDMDVEPGEAVELHDVGDTVGGEEAVESQRKKPVFPGWLSAIGLAWDRSTYGSYGDDSRALVDDACSMFGVSLPEDEAERDEILRHASSLVNDEAARIRHANADQGIYE